MDRTNRALRTPPPKALRTARILMFVQSVLGIAVGTVLLSVVASSAAGDDAGFELTLAAGVVLAAVLFVCAVLLPLRLAWVRGVAIAVEGINAASALVGVIIALASDSAPTPTAAMPFILSALVLRPLLQPEVRAWFADRAPWPPAGHTEPKEN
ncbi:hypothetical protein [Amycolatopsis rifamycinica]|uniref:Integral membrane protein n=1 Tax=Amycolatopsis rifamycinica TaxID=287986 RepID=A0A066U472_9PSEU|nr:hypothetical protein [Amycolatopsis rifamycinica]KDN21900.1 hypothetical protein DV20_13365 [Amycolatopsis rifamycinica]